MSAEDVVQEAFLQLVRRVNADDPPEIHLGARNASQESVQMLLVNEASLTPVERALFDELEKEISHGR
ncbi:MAG TPA: hypothetical protein EYG03_16570 [Planctomycetes bacterium]|nr:hypothetical protein [Planctomycetaceae bacterium]HIK93564.1 hypothetical protein [Planctomycetota bacterium]